MTAIGAYRAALGALLPPGRALDDGPGTVLDALLTVVAGAFARVDARAARLLDEADPRTTAEMLGDWERAFGLPAACTPEVVTVAGRRAQLLALLLAVPGASPAYFVALAAALGYPGATVSEFFGDGATCVSPCDAAVAGGSAAHEWQLNLPATAQIRVLDCTGTCVSPLRSWGDDVLACVLERLKPAHTIARVAYRGEL